MSEIEIIGTELWVSTLFWHVCTKLIGIQEDTLSKRNIFGLMFSLVVWMVPLLSMDKLPARQ